MQSGKKLEEIFFEYFMPEGYYGSGLRKATEKEDIEEGTDFFYNGIRFDITEDFSGKDNMAEGFQAEVDLPWAWIQLGIRTGNRKQQFEEPVVVIGVFAYSYESAKKVVFQLSEHWSEIFEKAFDLWCEYDDKNN